MQLLNNLIWKNSNPQVLIRVIITQGSCSILWLAHPDTIIVVQYSLTTQAKVNDQ